MDPQKSLLCEPVSSGQPSGCSNLTNLCAPWANGVSELVVRFHSCAFNLFFLLVSNLNCSNDSENESWILEHMLKICGIRLESVCMIFGRYMRRLWGTFWNQLGDVWGKLTIRKVCYTYPRTAQSCLCPPLKCTHLLRDPIYSALIYRAPIHRAPINRRLI